MKLTRAGSEDVPQLRSLWKEAFGDSDAFLDLFFGAVFPTCDAFCAREEETVCAMLFALPQVLACGEQEEKAAYLYAVATKEAWQKQGLCSKLLQYSVKKLRAKGVFCIYLACHTPALAAFYEKRGFCGKELTETAVSLPKPEGETTVISAVDYAGLRETLLFDSLHIRYPKAAFDLLQGAVFYRLQTRGTFGCACVENGRILECLPDERVLPALAAALGQQPMRMPDGVPQFMVYEKAPPFYAAFSLD